MGIKVRLRDLTKHNFLGVLISDAGSTLRYGQLGLAEVSRSSERGPRLLERQLFQHGECDVSSMLRRHG